jgi:hypothetical protein
MFPMKQIVVNLPFHLFILLKFSGKDTTFSRNQDFFEAIFARNQDFFDGVFARNQDFC